MKNLDIMKHLKNHDLTFVQEFIEKLFHVGLINNVFVNSGFSGQKFVEKMHEHVKLKDIESHHFKRVYYKEYYQRKNYNKKTVSSTRIDYEFKSRKGDTQLIIHWPISCFLNIDITFNLEKRTISLTDELSHSETEILEIIEFNYLKNIHFKFQKHLPEIFESISVEDMGKIPKDQLIQYSELCLMHAL